MGGPGVCLSGLPVVGEPFFSSVSLPPPAHPVDRRQPTRRRELGQPGSFRTLFNNIQHNNIQHEELSNLEPIVTKARPLTVGKHDAVAGNKVEDSQIRMHTAKLQPTHKAKNAGRRTREQRPNSSRDREDKSLGQRVHAITQLADSVGGSRHQREALARLASRKAIKYDLSLAKDMECEKKLLLDDYKKVISNIKIIMKSQPRKTASQVPPQASSPLEGFLSEAGERKGASPPPIKRHERPLLKSSGGARPVDPLTSNLATASSPPLTRGSSSGGLKEGRPPTPAGDEMPVREFRLSSRGVSEGTSQRSSMNEEDLDVLDIRLPQVGVGESARQDDMAGQSLTVGLASGRLEPLSVSTYRSIGSNVSEEKAVGCGEGAEEDLLASPPTPPTMMEASRAHSLPDPAIPLGAADAGKVNSQGQADSQLNVFNMLLGRRNPNILPALRTRAPNDLGWENDFVEMAEDDDIEVFLRNQMNPEPQALRTPNTAPGKKPRKKKEVESIRREKALKDKPR